jgi:hypothetical protein
MISYQLLKVNEYGICWFVQGNMTQIKKRPGTCIFVEIVIGYGII